MALTVKLCSVYSAHADDSRSKLTWETWQRIARWRQIAILLLGSITLMGGALLVGRYRSTEAEISYQAWRIRTPSTTCGAACA